MRRYLPLLLVLVAVAACSSSPTPVWNSPAAGAGQPVPSPTARAWSDPAGVGKPYPGSVNGLLTFRGNPTRTFYGTGPVPRTTPTELWQFPRNSKMCGLSSDAQGEREWCGNGWTGQPAIFERQGRTWIITGGYDHHVHFIDAATGERILPDFATGDLVKGSLTVDPNGYPLVYTGSRDNYFRVIAFDRDKPTELWRLDAKSVRPYMWNDDWDGAALVIDDYLFEGGENSNIHIIKLNRGYDAIGKATVKPRLVFYAPGWDAELLKAIGDKDVSIENSVAIYRDTLYFANSGGLVQGWNISGLRNGAKPKRVFRYWTGDDTDATITIDDAGMLYVGVQYERHTQRSKEVGQLVKLDPSKPDPLVWKVFDNKTGTAGVWGTPALYKDIAIFDTNAGDVLGIDRATGEVRWRFHLKRTWSSPVVVDGVLLLGDCTGDLYGYDVSDTDAEPTQLWSLRVGGCIESTPAVWKGVLYLATRWGWLHAIGAKQ